MIMKKKCLMFLCMISLIAMAACGKTEKDTESNPPVESVQENKVDVADCTELLAKVWDSYDEDQKFAISGGDYDNMVENSAGAVNVDNAENLDILFGMPADGAAMVDEGASIIHMMNANTFTAAAYHLKDSASQQLVADLLKDNIMNRQWMCGFPDTLLIASVGDDYMISAYGEAGNMEVFKEKLLAQYEVAEVIYEESLLE